MLSRCVNAEVAEAVDAILGEGTRKGSCHACGEEGHYSYECKGNGSNVMKLGVTSAQSEPSAYAKGK